VSIAIALAPARVGVGRAAASDAEAICELIRPFAQDGLMLPRSVDSVREGIGGFLVARAPEGEVVGAVGLRTIHSGLAEIVGFAVHRDWQGEGLGTELLIRVVDDALMGGFGRVFAMTLRPRVFLRLGFLEVERTRVPEKIHLDCVGCPYRKGCGERTVLLDVRGFTLTEVGDVPTLTLKSPLP
jgi:N-acetylglutamate synthase-like GNAT family acetyltransferase